MNAIILLTVEAVPTEAAVNNGPSGYIIGGIMALLIMGYLIYSLLRPDKF